MFSPLCLGKFYLTPVHTMINALAYEQYLRYCGCSNIKIEGNANVHRTRVTFSNLH